MPSRLEVSAGVPLEGEVVLDEILSSLDDDYLRRGFLFLRHVRALNQADGSRAAGTRFAAFRERLEAPPALGVYLPFHEYLTRDYFRVFDAAARLAHPELPSAEAYRLEGRRELESFLGQTIGRVTWSLFDDPQTPLVRYAQLARMVMTKPVGVPRVLGPRHVRIEYQSPIGSIPYGVGIFEGIVLSFRLHPRIAVETEGDRTSFDVRWEV